MNVSKLLRSLMTWCFSMGIVEAGGGGSGGSEVEDEGVVEDPLDEDPPTDDAPADDAANDGEGDGEGEPGEGDEIVVSLGEEPEPGEEDENRAPEWVRDLRKSNREKDRRIRELETKVAQSAPAPQAVVIGTKPTLEACDFDTEKFEQELEAWHGRKRAAEDERRQREQQAEQQQAQWTTRLDSVKTAAAGLKVRDYEDAGQAFDDTFSIVQQGIVIGGPEDPKASALLRYALGKNPKKAKELAAIKDPVKFAFAVAKLETQLKITPRKSAPAPDRIVRSSVAGAAAVDNQRARLEAEADKTGDRSKVAAYIRSKNQAKRAA